MLTNAPRFQTEAAAEAAERGDTTLEVVPDLQDDGEKAATFWCRIASGLLDENRALKAKLGDLRLAAHAVKGAGSQLERELACSVLVEMAVSK